MLHFAALDHALIMVSCEYIEIFKKENYQCFYIPHIIFFLVEKYLGLSKIQEKSLPENLNGASKG